MPEIKITSIDGLKKAAHEFIEQMGSNTIFAFHGDMGVGKTTFIKAICEVLGVKDIINSPTFSIINEYRTISEKPIYHFDFYRIKDETEALDFGYEDYVYSGYRCFIEWPERIDGLLPSETKHIYITKNDDSERIIKFS